MKRVLLLALFASATYAASAQSPAEARQIADTRAYLAKSDAVYPYLDTPPAFPGGLEKWNQYVAASKLMTDAVAKARTQGLPVGVYTVMLQFSVNPDGSMGAVRTVGKPVGYGLEEAAMKVVKESGKWTPANVEGENTKGTMQLPLRFVVQ